MPMQSDGTFSRVWKFVDQFRRGDNALRTSFDASLDDITVGINAALDRKAIHAQWDASSGAFPSGSFPYQSYIVTTAGTVDGVSFAVDDVVIALVRNASTATFSANWRFLERAGKPVLLNTKAAADAALAGLSNGDVVDVGADETRGGYRTRYRVEGGALVFKLRLEPLVEYDSVSALRNSDEPARGAGAIWQAAGFRYEEAPASASDHHLDPSQGWPVKLYVVPDRGYVDVRQCGAVLDGLTDDSPAVATAVAAAKAANCGLSAPAERTCRLATGADLRGVAEIEFLANIIVTPNTTVTVGGFSDGLGCAFRFADITDGTLPLTASPPGVPVLRVFGLKSSKISLKSCNYVQFYADEAEPGGTSNAYNAMVVESVISKLELTGATGVSWNNENAVHGGRLQRLIIDGVNYPHNHNRFLNNSFEGADVDIQFLGAAHVNSIQGARFEGVASAPGVSFAAGSYSNTVAQTWSGVGSPRGQFSAPSVPVSDLGMGNAVFRTATSEFRRTPLFSVSASSIIVGNATDSASFVPSVPGPGLDRPSKQVFIPGLDRIGMIYGFRHLALTGLIPVRLGDVITFDSDFEGARARTRIFVFDASQQPITSEGGGGVYVQQPSAPAIQGATFGVYAPDSNLTAAAINILSASVVRPEVAYVRVGIEFGPVGPFRHVAAYLWTKPQGAAPEPVIPPVATPVLNGAVTRGFAPLGSAVFDWGANVTRWVSLAHETSAAASLSAGATTATVADATGVANNDVVGLLMDDGTTHWSLVSALSGASFSIDAIPAGRSVPSGARVTFNRWTS